MLAKIKLAIALTATVAGGGAVAANHGVLFGGSGPAPQVSTSQQQAATIDANATVDSAPSVSVPTVPQGPATNLGSLPAAPASVHASAQSSTSADASITAPGGLPDPSAATSTPSLPDPAAAKLALDMVKGLRTQCPALLSELSSATKDLTAVPTSASAVFKVTATATGTANAEAGLLVDVDAHTISSTDPLLAAALSACTTLAQSQPSAIGGPLSVSAGPLTLTIGG
jgi:hypothetical protein